MSLEVTETGRTLLILKKSAIKSYSWRTGDADNDGSNIRSWDFYHICTRNTARSYHE